MITNPVELTTTMDRIKRLQDIVLAIRASRVSGENYKASAEGFLAEIDRMMLEVREYLWLPANSNEFALAA
jgi:hypothetical protein